MNCDNEQDRVMFSDVYDVLSKRLLYFEKESLAVFVWHLIEQAKTQKIYPHAVKYLSQVVDKETKPELLAVLVRKLFCHIGVRSELMQLQDKVIADFEENFGPILSTSDLWRKCRITELELATRLSREKEETEELSIRKKERMNDFESLKSRLAARGERLSNATRTRAPFIRTKRTPLQDSPRVIELKINSFADIFLTTQALFLFDEETAHYLHASLVVEKMCENATVIRKGKDIGTLDEEKLEQLLADYLYWLLECRKKFRVHELCVMLSSTAYGTTSQFNNVYFAVQEMCADEDKYGKFAVVKSGRKKSLHRPTAFSPLDHGGVRMMAILAYESYIKLLADFRALQEQVFKKNLAAYNMSTIHPPLAPPLLDELEIPGVLSGIERYVNLESVSSPKVITQRSSERDRLDSDKRVIRQRRRSSRGKDITSKNEPEIVLQQPHLRVENDKPGVGTDPEFKPPKNAVLPKTRYSLRSREIGRGAVPLETEFQSTKQNAGDLVQPKQIKSHPEQLPEYSWTRKDESLAQNVLYGSNHHGANYENESGPTQTLLQGSILDYPDDFYDSDLPVPDIRLPERSLSGFNDQTPKTTSGPPRHGNDMVTYASGKAKEVAADFNRQSSPDIRINRNEENHEDLEVHTSDMGRAKQYPQTYRPSAPENAKSNVGNETYAPTDPGYQESLAHWLSNSNCDVARQDLEDAVCTYSNLDEVVGHRIHSSRDKSDPGNTQNKTRSAAIVSPINSRLGNEEAAHALGSRSTDRIRHASATIGKSPKVHSRIPTSENYPRQEDNTKESSDTRREDAADWIVNFDIDTAFMDEDCNEIFDSSKNLTPQQKRVKEGWDELERMVFNLGSSRNKATTTSLEESPGYMFTDEAQAIYGEYQLDPIGHSLSGSSEDQAAMAKTQRFEPDSPEYKLNEDAEAIHGLYNLDPHGYSISGSIEGK